MENGTLVTLHREYGMMIRAVKAKWKPVPQKICYRRLIIGFIVGHLLIALFANLNIYSFEMRIFALFVYIFGLVGSFVEYVTGSIQRDICTVPNLPFVAIGIYLLLTGIIYIFHRLTTVYAFITLVFNAQALLGLGILFVTAFSTGHLFAYAVRRGL